MNENFFEFAVWNGRTECVETATVAYTVAKDDWGNAWAFVERITVGGKVFTPDADDAREIQAEAEYLALVA